MGYDGKIYSEGYLGIGDTTIFKLYDQSEQEYFTLHASEHHGFQIYEMFMIDNMRVSMDYEIPLHYYFNLISFYGLPEDDGVSAVMADLDNLVNIQGESKSAMYLSGAGGGWQGSLTEFDVTDGYWLRMSGAETLSGWGHPYDLSRIYPLHVGANLISFPAKGRFDIGAALPDEHEGKITAIIGEGLSTIASSEDLEELPTWEGSLDYFEGLHGYWVFANEAFDLSFEVLPGDNLARSISGSPMVERPEGLEFIQSSEQAFYYVNEEAIEGLGIEHGDWLVSICGSNVSGSRQYIGTTMDVPAMGYDGYPVTAGYCEKGDRPKFKLYKAMTGEMIELHAEVPAWDSNGIFFIEHMMEAPPLPTDYSMLSAYPNPFNPVTNIGFEIPEESMVKIIVYDLRGQEVATLVNGMTVAGRYSVNWDANDVASGIYFVNFTALRDGHASVAKIQKLMLVK